MDNKLKTLSEGVAALSQVEVWLRPACPLTDVYIERPKKKAPKPAMISKRKRGKKGTSLLSTHAVTTAHFLLISLISPAIDANHLAAHLLHLPETLQMNFSGKCSDSQGNLV